MASTVTKKSAQKETGVVTHDSAGRVYFTEQDICPLPNLIEVQKDSYKKFLEEGLTELFAEINPITDFTAKKLELRFTGHKIDAPAYTEHVAKYKNITYESAIRVQVQLINKVTGEVKEQDVYLGNIPLMTERGTFVVNGVERVVVNQINRSPGIYFLKNQAGDGYTAKIIPNRGAWIELKTNKKGVLSVKIDKKRKMPVTTLLRAFGYSTNDDIIKLFEDVRGDVGADPEDLENDILLKTLEKDTTTSVEEGLAAFYKRMRPGDLATADNARSLLESIFFDFRRYDMGRVGRYKVSQKFGMEMGATREHRIFDVEYVICAVKELIRLEMGESKPDDIDHLSNRRIRCVGELVQNKFRVGLLRTERIIKDRMTVLEHDTLVPTQLINARPITAAMREFFASSQLSQFMDQTNPLSELDHKRRLSAMGPGGLTRERASFDVRDVHATHYGRICPIATPEGPNIGLVVHLASYARLDSYGFLLTPYYKVIQALKNKEDLIVGHSAAGDICDEKGKVIVKDHEPITAATAKTIAAIKSLKEVPVIPFVSTEYDYIDATQEGQAIICDANTDFDEKRQFVSKRISARVGMESGEASMQYYKDISHMDVSPKQIVSISTSLIPFLEHDEGARALMGSNMQRQAVPLIRPNSPLVGTGMEHVVAENSDLVVIAPENGEITYVDASRIEMKGKSGEVYEYDLIGFSRSNQGTALHQKPVVSTGQKITKGQLLTDGTAIQGGELALGQNLLVSFMPWRGWNFEDAVIVSDKVIREDMFSSMHIEEHVVDVRDTKLGPEMITRDIPNVGEDRLKDLDEDGVIRIGAEVKEGAILVGKITPKGETDLTAEERLLRAIFGEKARDVKDTSMTLPGGQIGKVVGIQMFSRANGDDLPTGVRRQVKVLVAQIRQLSIGDKMAGRHGNKGVISRIVPSEDMPHLEDGTPVDIILNPLGVISRMNLGQILETHLGWAADKLGYKVATPVLNGVPQEKIEEELVKAGLPAHGRVQLYDGMTGEAFDDECTVGMIYMLKLIHMVDDKIHARSIGPYSLVTQQPLGGKAQHGGQRFGEMEVWALEAYGAAHTLQEILTIKSDDVLGRSKAYESIIKGEDIKQPRIPESFNVLVRELRSLGLEVELLKRDQVMDIEVDLLADITVSNDDEDERTIEKNIKAMQKDAAEDIKEQNAAAATDLGESMAAPDKEEADFDEEDAAI
jgi:DNA-directed RNA polymerase subunit beta